MHTIVYYKSNMTGLTILIMNLYSYPNVLHFIFLLKLANFQLLPDINHSKDTNYNK